MSNRFFIFSCGWIVLGLASCAPPADPTKKSVSIGRMGIRSVAAAEAGAETVSTTPGPAPAVSNPSVSAKPQEAETRSEPVQPGMAGTNDNIRLPNMLGLPEEKELQATNPKVPNSGSEGGAVIARPPAEKAD